MPLVTGYIFGIGMYTASSGTSIPKKNINPFSLSLLLFTTKIGQNTKATSQGLWTVNNSKHIVEGSHNLKNDL